MNKCIELEYNRAKTTYHRTRALRFVLTRVGTAESVSRDKILRHARRQGNINFPCSADHEQDGQPYPVDPYSAICDDIHAYPTTATEDFDYTFTVE